jgi:hypothetical protein
MRWLSPTPFYVISEGGEVVRRFTVDPGNPGYMPVAMHLAGGRSAVLYYESNTRNKFIKLIDLDGQDIGAYTLDEAIEKEESKLGLAFACYSQNPERFTFLTETENGTLGLQLAQLR